jgi:apoptosis-inducing factor 3
VFYDKLVLATGGTPRVLPIPGADLQNVFKFRQIEDAQKVDAAAQEGKKAVFLGSSFISMEIVTAISKRGLSEIHVIGMEEHPFEIVLGKEVGAALQKVGSISCPVFHAHV